MGFIRSAGLQRNRIVISRHWRVSVRWAATAFIILAFGTIGGLRATGQSTAYPAYAVGMLVTNLSDQTNECVRTSYNPDGTQIGLPFIETIPPYGAKTWFPLSHLPPENPAVFVTCEYPYALLTNILASDFSAAGSYVVPVTGTNHVTLPLLNKENNGYTTWYSLQNVDESWAQVEITYSDGTTVAPLSIPPYADRQVFQSEEDHPQAIFAGTLSSDRPIRAAVLQEGDGIIFAYTGVPSSHGGTVPPPEEWAGYRHATMSTVASENPVFPLVNANNGGYVTGIQILNGGDKATDVTVAYTPSAAGSGCTETRSIAAESGATFALAAFANGAASDCTAGERFIGSAMVTANSTAQPLTGIVNQLLPGVKGEAYVGFAAEEATDSLIMPLIMDRNSGFYTGFSVQHVGGPESEVNCIFVNSAYTISGTLRKGEALVDIQQNQIADGYIGSCICTADNEDTKIVAVVNQVGEQIGVDNLLVYEGLALQ
jgi:hypothetical protein